jgi:hypothetical protein
MPEIDHWLVQEPVRLTKRGCWPTIIVVGLLQIGMVFLAKASEMPQFAWIPVGLCVAPLIYFLFESAQRPQPVSFGELLERQVVAENAKPFS